MPRRRHGLGPLVMNESSNHLRLSVRASARQEPEFRLRLQKLRIVYQARGFVILYSVKCSPSSEVYAQAWIRVSIATQSGGSWGAAAC